MSQLYALTAQYKELSEFDASDEAVAQTLEGLKGEIDEKGKGIAILSNGFEANIMMIDDEIARLNAMKKVIQNRNTSVRNYLKSNMQAAGITNIKCDLFSITLAKGRDVVSITDEDSLPDEYTNVKTSIAPDKKKILAALKDGTDIPGASLTKSDESLRIK